MKITSKHISGWGNYPQMKAKVCVPETVQEIADLVVQSATLLARGNGRSYGDSSLAPLVVDMTGMNKVISISTNTDTIEVEAGITLGEILQQIIPAGRFLAVTPGIKSITVGGAIASDVHGKNHHQQGSFYQITQSFILINADGECCYCSRTENPALFYRTFGAMGLTGVIVSARIRLLPIETSWIREEHYFPATLPQLLDLFNQHLDKPFLVGWIDFLAKENKLLLKTGSWVTKEALPGNLQPLQTAGASPLRVPFLFPFPPPRFLFRWYNKRYFRRAVLQPVHIIHYDAFFYPLDQVEEWRRIYGPGGMLQYHLALPRDQSLEGLTEIISMVRASKATCTLGVIKIFGKTNELTTNSFPLEGFNLALDFIRNAEAVKLVKELDRLVSHYKGRIYKTKDALSSLPGALPGERFQSLQNRRYAG